MRVAQKLTLALVASMFAVLATHAWLSARRETSFLRADTRRDGHVLGRALVAVVREVWRAQGDARAHALIEEANERDASVELRWVSLAPTAEERRRPTIAVDRLTGLGAGREVVTTEHVAGHDRLFTYVPLTLAGMPPTALEISESLTEQAAHVRTGLLANAITTAVLAVVAATLTLALGSWFVGRPMRVLIEKARRVGSGDLTGPLALAQRDELGELAIEMNAMCDRLADAKARLADETAARIDALDQLRHADRLAIIGKIASGVAHELGTPLHVVSGWAKMIRGNEVAGAELHNAASVIADQSDRMAKIIRDLLDFGRRRGPKKAEIELRAVVQQTLAFIGPMLARRRVEVRNEWDVAASSVLADSGQIQQALANLIVNGVDAMPNGGALTIGLRRERREGPHTPAQPWVCLYVRDEGEGIAAEDLPRIFEPFFTTKKAGEGTGLGLSVSEGIVQEHGGFLEVESAPGRGTCFSIYLPAFPLESPTRRSEDECKAAS